MRDRPFRMTDIRGGAEIPHKREDARYRSTWHVMKKLFINQKWKMSLFVVYGCIISVNRVQRFSKY